MAMGVDQSRQENVLTEIHDVITGGREFCEFTDLNDLGSVHPDRAVLNGWAVHRDHDARANDHLLL